MDIPIGIFAIFLGMALTFLVVGLSRRIGVAILMSGMFILTIAVATDNITTDTFFSDTIENLYSYNIESRTGVGSLSSVNQATGEFVSSSSSMLLGDTINCIDLYLSKTGSPTGTAQIGIMDNSNPPVATTEFGSIDVSTLTNAGTWKTFCLSGDNTYTIQNNDRIGIRYITPGAGTVDVGVDANNPFDGTVTYRQFFTAGAWSSLTGQDMMGRFYLTGQPSELIPNNFVFSELIKVLFALIGIMLMLVGVLYFRNE